MGLLNKVRQIFHDIYDNAYQISRETDKKRLLLIVDIIGCMLKYSASPNNYAKFEFYHLNSIQRKTYVTYGLSKKMIQTFNNPAYISVFENKLRFAEEFKNVYQRDYLNVTTMGFEEFEKFCQGKDKFICKPIDGSQGTNIKVYHIDNVKKMYAEIKGNYESGYMLEEWIQQHPTLNRIYPDAVNCLRIITVYDGDEVHFLTGGVTFGIETEIANGSQASIIAPVNLDTGFMDKPAATFGSILYEKHPKTNVKIQGVKIPFWDEVKDMLRTVCKHTPNVGYIGWDVAITPKGPIIIEGNTTPGYKYYQIPKHLENGIGNRQIYQRHLK